MCSSCKQTCGLHAPHVHTTHMLSFPSFCSWVRITFVVALYIIWVTPIRVVCGMGGILQGGWGGPVDLSSASSMLIADAAF